MGNSYSSKLKNVLRSLEFLSMVAQLDDEIILIMNKT